MEYIPTTDKFVVILNKKISTGKLMNAIGHMTAGLVSLYSDDLQPLRFQVYTDKDGTNHHNISDNPYIVLRADNSNQIRTLRNQIIERNIKFTDFIDTMTEGTYVDQHERTNNTTEADLAYFGICFFMNSEESKELTKKFSLFN